MNRLKTSLDAMAREIASVSLDGEPFLDGVLRELRERLELEVAVSYRPARRAQGWELELMHQHGLARPQQLITNFSRFLEHAPPRFAWYNAVSPEAAQRNVVLNPFDFMSRPHFEASAMAREVFLPAKLAHLDQVRVLVCEGPSLLAWFGGFLERRPGLREARALRRLVGPLRKRLAFERTMARATQTRAAVDL